MWPFRKKEPTFQVGVLQISDNDVVVLVTESTISDSQAQRLRQAWDKHCKGKAVVLSGGLQLKTILKDGVVNANVPV